MTLGDPPGAIVPVEDMDAKPLRREALGRELEYRGDEIVARSAAHELRAHAVADVECAGLRRRSRDARGAPKQQYPNNRPASVTAQ